MAIAGDIIIKLAADFAQFAEGMTKSAEALGDLGKQAEKTNASLQSAIGWLKGLAGTAAVAFVVNKINAYTEAIDQQALAIAKLQQQYKLSAIEVQALQAAVDKTGKSFAELVEHASKNPKWLDSLILDAQSAGTALDEGVVRSISDMDAKSTEATKKINAMFAPFYASTKATALENIANTLDGIIALMTRAANHEGFWSKMGSLFHPGVRDPITGQLREANEREKDLLDIEAAARRVTAAQQEIDRATQSGASNPRHDAVRAAELAAAQRELDKLRNAEVNRAARASANIVGNTETSVPFIKTLEPTTVTGTKGGGGRTDLETIDALILRYQKMQEAATDAQNAMRLDITTDIKDLSLVIEAKQAVAEAVAKLVARGIDVPQKKIDELERTIFLSKQAQAEQARSLQYATQADATENRLSGTTKGLAEAQQNLTRQFLTNRLGVVAYDRALAELAEQQEHIRLQSTRMDNSLESLAAGFADAALTYARANDNFAQGGQIFNAFTGAMGEGLDVLSGKSSKTFGQIASDFATMLAKMALQAALSPVFKLLANALGFGGLGTAGLPGSPYYGPPAPGASTATARAGGGAVYAGQPYWVGEQGPERFVPSAAGSIQPAGGGDVVVNIANYTDSKVSAGKSKGPGGQLQVDVIVEAVEGKMAARLSRGQGALGKTMEGSYGLQRVGR